MKFIKKLILTAALCSGAQVGFAAGFQSNVQDSCSNLSFAFLDAEAGITGTCLRNDGLPVQSSVTIKGISNRDGVLTIGGGASTFQRTCGAIRVLQQGDAIILHARCRNLSGHAQPTSIELKGLSNQNGVLSN